MRHGVSGEELPDVPGGGARGELGVGSELDDGDGPLPAVHAAEDGGVEGCWDAVCVALVADQGDSFADGADPPGEWHEVAIPASASIGVCSSDFANDMRLVVIKVVELLDKGIRLAVRMIIANPWLREIIPIMLRARRNNSNIRVRLINSLEETREAVLLIRLPARGEAGQPVLVADLDVAQGEGVRVTELGADGAPFGVGGAADEFDFVESVVDEGLEFFFGGDVAVEGEAGPDSDDWVWLVHLQLGEKG